MNGKFSVSDPKTAAARLFCLICVLFGGYLVAKHLLPALLPFLIAFCIASVTVPIAERSSKKTGLPYPLCVVILLLFIISVGAGAVFFTVRRIVSEGERLLLQLSESGGVNSALDRLFSRLSALGDESHSIFKGLAEAEVFRELVGGLDRIATALLSDAVSALTRGLPRFIFSAIKTLPSFILFVSVTVLSSFYICLDHGKIKKAALGRLPPSVSEKLCKVKKQMVYSLRRYLRAYLLLLLLTFVLLFAGFLILRVSYPLLLALTVSLVDLLPVLGVGTVLIPWGLFELILSRNIPLGLGLLVLYVTAVTVRQLAEPRLVSSSLGLHPLATLIAIYGGFRLFGVWGMLLAPTALLAVKSLFDSNIDKADDV